MNLATSAFGPTVADFKRNVKQVEQVLVEEFSLPEDSLLVSAEFYETVLS